MLLNEENELMTRVGPGTPAGEMLRRYWWPVGFSEEVKPKGAPVKLRLLGEDLVAFHELRHAGADFLHHTRHVPAGNQRKLVLDEPIQRTGTHFPIERVHASGMNTDEHFAFPYLWTWRIFVLQDFRSTVTVHSDCVHKF